MRSDGGTKRRSLNNAPLRGAIGALAQAASNTESSETAQPFIWRVLPGRRLHRPIDSSADAAEVWQHGPGERPGRLRGRGAWIVLAAMPTMGSRLSRVRDQIAIHGQRHPDSHVNDCGKSTFCAPPAWLEGAIVRDHDVVVDVCRGTDCPAKLRTRAMFSKFATTRHVRSLRVPIFRCGEFRVGLLCNGLQIANLFCSCFIVATPCSPGGIHEENAPEKAVDGRS